jgi:GNAT superfamily N-acetyltransferase
MLRKLDLADMDAAAQIHRTAFDAALPWLAGRHTPQEDRWFFRERLFKTCQLWGAFDAAQMTGIIAFREDWVDQLYVLPSSQQRGIGTRLLRVAQCALPRLHLWTFQGNVRARRFYEKRGFLLIEETDGAGNEEKAPDALYLWARNQAQRMDSASS